MDYDFRISYNRPRCIRHGSRERRCVRLSNELECETKQTCKKQEQAETESFVLHINLQENVPVVYDCAITPHQYLHRRDIDCQEVIR
jgi:hypothetical protein